MASPTLKELKYRTFDDLMNEVYGDLPALTREGLVEPAQLIKIAQRVNNEIGLKIHGTKETILEVEHGRAKLPSDFHILNLALLCHHHVSHSPGLFNGLHTEDVAVHVLNPNSIPQPTTCPCWTIQSVGGSCPIVHCDGTKEIMFFPANDDQSIRTITMCLASIDLGNQTPDGSRIIAATNSFCFNDPATGDFVCGEPAPGCCTPPTPKDTCKVVNADPWKQNRVYTTCNNTMEVNVIEYRSDEVREYRSFDKIHMKPSKEASAFCVNTQFDDARHEGFIRDGYLFVPTLHHEGHHGRSRVYICYLGAMEDAEGNLLVLDHPKINEFYEWALKARVFENLYLNGEPDIENRLKLAKSELKTARAEALSIVTMPDFYELKKAVEINRKAMYAKYLHPFSSLYGNTPGWPGAYNTDHL